MKLEYDQRTKTLTATVSRAEQIDLNDYELPVESEAAKRGRKLKSEILDEHTRLMSDSHAPIEIKVVVANNPVQTPE